MHPHGVRYKILLTYDGTHYAGWQVQPGNDTIQGRVESAIETFLSTPVKVHGSGRTDRGVHARQQVAHFDLPTVIDVRMAAKALNAALPPDIRVVSLRRTTADFHARRSAVRKEYRYFIWNGGIVPPFLRQYRTHVRKPLDVVAMRQAAHFLVGRHDFSAFSANPDRVVESHVRNLQTLRVTRHGAEIVISAVADGFLYKMVRSLAGFLIRVGEGAVAPEAAKDILRSGIRTARVPTARPEGLFLWNVKY